MYSGAYAQVFNGLNNSSQVPFITAYFVKEDLIIEPESTFFNIVVLKNEGSQREEVFLEINVPVGWSVMALDQRSYLIDPGDSLLVPVRAAPAKGVEGEIGYSVIASINDRDEETLTNAYSFVKIPRLSDLRFRPLTRVSFFDQQSGEANLSFQITNRGNVNELMHLLFESTRNVELQNERDNLLAMDLNIAARSDTVITLPARRIDDVDMQNGSLYRVDVRATSQERTFNTSFWFNHLTSRYRYRIPPSEKMLVLDVAAQNLLSEQNTYLVGGVRGNILLPENKSIAYRFYKYGSDPDIWRYSRMHLAYHTPAYNIILGDITSFPLRNGFGKGGQVDLLMVDQYRFSFLAGQNTFRPIDNYGFMMTERRTPLGLSPRYSYTDNRHMNSKAHTAGLTGQVSLFNNHNLRVDFGFSDVSYQDSGENEPGYGLNLNYHGRINQTMIRIREQFGTTGYYGTFAGRHQFSAQVTHPLQETLNLDVIFNDRRYKPVRESSMGTISNRYQENREARVLLRKWVDRNLNFFGGPIYQRKSTNSFFLFDEQNPFTSHSIKANLGLRIRDMQGTSFNPSAAFGYTFVTNYSTPENNVPAARLENPQKNMFTSHVSLNLRRNTWGTYLNYFYGPYSVNQEISEFYFGIATHSVRIMPYLERFIYRDIVRLSSKVSFLHDFSFKTSRLILNNQMDVYLPHDYTISLLNTFSYQTTTDLLTEDSYSYSNNYFELRLTKEFNWNQPRIKYYDLEVNLFKDLNGNLVRDFNEPGVRDILVHITSIDPIKYSQHGADYEASGTSVSTRLLTDHEGRVFYDNLARGVYKIRLENIGRDQDKYFPDQSEFIINLTRDKTVYVPYLERNKIFGRAILNRSRLSTLGRIEVGNIKVTATDSKGRETSTLTNSDGYFEMYVPSVDHYVVSINNIFRDHFNLRQNDFRANLNGFKQFEVNFVFDEIRRQIEFTPSAADIETEIRRVGRTNLSGTVRDASTLQPIRAQVEVVDNTTGRTIERTVTDRSNGRYTATFATGENYMIVVSANGYWMHSERLVLDQYLTIQDSERDILLESITIGARFQLNNLRFTPGSLEIPTEAKPELDRLIAQLRQNPHVRIRIEGHSDARETLDNPNLSMQRAEAVMRYMVENGFSNIEFTGLRDTRPIAPSDTEENRRRNRRVEIIVTER